MRILVMTLLVLFLSAWENAREKDMKILIHRWKDREVLFPKQNYFTVLGRDTVPFPFQHKYKILYY